MAGAKRHVEDYTDQELRDRLALGRKLAKRLKAIGQPMPVKLVLEHQSLVMEQDRRKNEDKSHWLSSRRAAVGFGDWA